MHSRGSTGYGINNPQINRLDKLGFRSHHAGGAYFAFGDAHVQFLKESISQTVLASLTTRRGDVLIRQDATGNESMPGSNS